MSNWPTNGNLTGKLSVGQGEPGKSLEYKWRGTELGIRQEGEEEYQFVNLVSGLDGREIELQVGNGYIQWRYVGEETWKNLISIAELKGGKGDKGDKGNDGRDGIDGENGKSLEFDWKGTELGVKREDSQEFQYTNLEGRQGIQGADGRDGITPNIKIGNVVSVESSEPPSVTIRGDKENPILDFNIPKGKQGLQGINGNDGTNGTNGQDGVTPNIQIGTVTTLEAGQQATVTREGTNENPIFNFGIPQGVQGTVGDTPDMSDFENKINKQYEIIKVKVDKIEQEDIPVEIPIVGNTLTLTTAKRQKANMKNNTTIVLPVVDKFTEIHLTFSTTEELTLILPKIKWQSDISIEANKTYEFIFTYDDEWMGGCISYE